MNTPMIIGRQTFDGLGRQLTVAVGTNTTQFHYVSGQLALAANTLADGHKVAYTYEKQLNHQLLNVEGQDETSVRMTYQPVTGLLATARGALGSRSFEYTPSGQALHDKWAIDGTVHATHWKYSMGGLLQGFDDAQGVTHRREFDEVGRVQRSRVDNVETRYVYDALSRLVTVEVSDPDNQNTLTTHITYDAQGREHTRTFVSSGHEDEAGRPRTLTQTLTYSALDQIASRSWIDGTQRGEERFAYDIRDRLVRYTANEAAAPEDPYGNRIVEQVFAYNALNGHEKVINTFSDGTQDEATFTYATNNPCQVVKINHTHESWPESVTLAYDNCGRVIGDSLGRSMKWDTQGRLTEVTHEGHACAYHYDPQGRLVDREFDGVLTRRFFSAEQFTHEQTGDDRLQCIGDGDALFALTKVTAGIRKTMLLGSDSQGSVRLEIDEAVRQRGYTAHGAQNANDEQAPFGFAGERAEPITGWHIPGGYRPYDPVLMCFLAPDSDSPFGHGGINPYAYCAGDPVNRVDPDGHSWVGYALAGAGLALSAIALVPGLQAAIPLVGALFSAKALLTTTQMGCLVAAAMDIISLGTGIASLALEISGQDATAAKILGGVSLATGLVGAGLGLKIRNLRRVGVKQHALDVKNGWTSPKPHRLGSSEMLIQRTSTAVDVGFIEAYRGTKQAALLTHGDPRRALLLGPDGKITRAADLARDFIAPRLRALNYPADETFVLISCSGGRSGAALEIAKELGRPVQGYTHNAFVKSFANLQRGSVRHTPKEAIPYFEKLLATGNPIKAWKQALRDASAKIYYPDGTVTAAL